MDPTKKIGKSKEQVSMEHKARRNYHFAWAKVADNETNRFYHQDEINKNLKKKLKLQDLCPYQHNGKGESFFVSPEMHEQLLATCRCGRTRTGTHMLKCLQKAVNPYLTKDKETTEPIIVPVTSNSFIGWQQGSKPSYYQLEQSMKYVSPLHTMPGPRITDTPYHTIFIG